MTMNEDYVSYELALKLKRAGFDEPCIAQWACEPDGKPFLMGSTAFVFSNAELKGRDVTAPLLYHAQKWLREKKKLHILVDSDLYGKWYYKVFPIGECCIDEGNSNYVTYEQALSAGVSSALDLLAGKEGEG